MPTRSNDVELFPGISKSWGLSFHDQRRTSADWTFAGQPRLGEASPTATTGSIRRRRSAASTLRRFSRSAITRRCRCSSISRLRCISRCLDVPVTTASAACRCRRRRSGCGKASAARQTSRQWRCCYVQRNIAPSTPLTLFSQTGHEQGYFASGTSPSAGDGARSGRGLMQGARMAFVPGLSMTCSSATRTA